MLPLLTKYLLQYRTVTIPHVGTVQIIQYPSQLVIADKKLLPPTFSASLKKEDEVSAHQLRFLHTSLGRDEQAVSDDLKLFGNDLADKINGSGFTWEGIGRFGRSTQSFTIPAAGLNEVAAEKVVRTQADHKVLVGDRQTSSLQIADEKAISELVPAKRSGLVLIGWIVFLASLLAIALLLYKGKFKVGAGGSKLPPSGWTTQ